MHSWFRVAFAVRIRIASFLVISLFILPAWLRSQTSTNEVHVIPRSIEKPKDQPVITGNKSDNDLNFYSKPLRADVDLVLVPVSVRDDSNRPITDLQKNNFMVYEDEKEQEVQGLWREDAPISVGLILDFSRSMSDKMESVRYAVEEFFKNANSKDDYFVIAVSDRPTLIADSTDSIEDLERRIDLVVPTGNTALLDAMYVGIRKMRSARYQRRALVIISDGGDNHSYYNAKKIKRLAQEADVMIYSIGIFDNMPVPVFKTIEEKLGQHLLTTITELTGGYTIAADDRKKVPEFAAAISRQLRQQYILAYHPKHARRDGKWRKIKVQVTAPDTSGHLHIDHKRGYFSPA